MLAPSIQNGPADASIRMHHSVSCDTLQQLPSNLSMQPVKVFWASIIVTIPKQQHQMQALLLLLLMFLTLYQQSIQPYAAASCWVFSALRRSHNTLRLQAWQRLDPSRKCTTYSQRRAGQCCCSLVTGGCDEQKR